MFIHLWQGVALPTLLFLAGLQTIPSELYEAAAIDGANAWQQFKSITVAYLIPTLSVVLVLVVKQGLMVFDLCQIVSNDLWDKIKSGIDRYKKECK